MHCEGEYGQRFWISAYCELYLCAQLTKKSIIYKTATERYRSTNIVNHFLVACPTHPWTVQSIFDTINIDTLFLWASKCVARGPLNRWIHFISNRYRFYLGYKTEILLLPNWLVHLIAWIAYNISSTCMIHCHNAASIPTILSIGYLFIVTNLNKPYFCHLNTSFMIGNFIVSGFYKVDVSYI